LYFHKAPEVKVIDRIGAGDAFTAGFIYGYLKKDVELALTYATTLAALKCTIPGDIPYITKQDVDGFIKSEHKDIER